MPADPAVLHLQAGLVSALELARERSDTEACAEMHGVRALIATLLTGRQAAVATAELDVEPIAWGDGRHQLETARRPVRGQVLQVCERLLTDWPDGFRCIARRLSLRGEHFSRHRLLPGWLRAEVERLPKGRVLLAPRRRPSLEQQLEALRTRQPDNWRALRATLMLRVAQRRS